MTIVHLAHAVAGHPLTWYLGTESLCQIRLFMISNGGGSSVTQAIASLHSTWYRDGLTRAAEVRTCHARVRPNITVVPSGWRSPGNDSGRARR